MAKLNKSPPLPSPLPRAASARQWTDSQHHAIMHAGGDLLVSAAAGSGKTAVLAERCARLVCEPPAATDGSSERPGVEHLLVLTFTEAAANEMRARIAAAIRDKLTRAGHLPREEFRRLRRQAAMVDRAAISTLHAFCARVLRQHFHEAQVDPAFEVMDEEEARLLQEEVLDQLLAKWHKHPTEADGQRFGEFFEAYAQGRETACREMILSLHRMLSVTATPADYIKEARQLFTDGPDGCAKTLADFVTTTLADRLRVGALTARRACDDVRRTLGPSPMLDGLTAAALVIENARQALLQNGTAAWTEAQTHLAYSFPTLKTDKNFADFERLKKRTWDATKPILKKLAADFVCAPATMLKDLQGLARPLETLLALATEFNTAFTAAKRAENHLDFNDLERLTLDLLEREGNQAVLDLRTRYHHLLIDEFQDINPLQAALLDTVRSADRFQNQGNMFVVGDVKQSIYGFRLAEPALFHARERLARTHIDGHRYVALPHNFRSRPALLSVMNGVFERVLTPEVAGIAYHDGHALQAGLTITPTPEDPPTFNGIPVEVHLVALDLQDDADDDSPDPHADSDTAPAENLSAFDHEARMVADRIAALIEEGRTLRPKDGPPRKIQYRDIAILLRSMKNKAMLFARALARRGIPVHADLSTGFFDTPEVRDALALLHVLDNPHQDVPLATTLLGPYGNFSHDDLARIRLAFDKKEVPFTHAVARYSGADATARHPSTPLETADPLALRLHAFFASAAQWREKLRTRPLHEGLAEIFSESKIFPYLASLDAGDQRIANLQMLHQRALTFSGFRKQGLHRFLRFIERLTDDDSGGGGGEAPVLSEASDVVRIMSVHKSKGLEFPVVFLSGLGGKFRHASGAPVLIHRSLGIGLQVADIEGNVFYRSVAAERIADAEKRSQRAEELRLLYVAITRARDCLHLTGHLSKTAELDAWRSHWQHHDGPLPEDILLKANRPLDWLMPALATGASTLTPGRLHISWNASPLAPLGPEQVRITLHAPQPADTHSAESSAAQEQFLAKILVGEPLDESPTAASARVAAHLHHITGTYPHAAATKQPATQTVTFLKSQAPTDPSPDELPTPAPADFKSPTLLSPPPSAKADAARLRGIATHRILECLDFSAASTPAAIAAQCASLLESHRLTQDDLDRADWPGIHWFLHDSAAGQRLRTAAADSACRILRELPFTWTPPSGSLAHSSLADSPTIRGILDLLLVNPATRTAGILDYKTDSAFLWQDRLDDYRRQMHYYLEAASDILGFPVGKATLIFLSPREEILVTP